MAGPNDKIKSEDLDLDIKKTGTTVGEDQAGELREGELNDVAGGAQPNHTITRPDLCGSTGCQTA